MKDLWAELLSEKTRPAANRHMQPTWPSAIWEGGERP